MTDDVYSLECWLRDKALEAHNRDCKDCKMQHACRFDTVVCPDVLEVETYNKVISYIQSRRVSQRPHIRITEEFDGGR